MNTTNQESISSTTNFNKSELINNSPFIQLLRNTSVREVSLSKYRPVILLDANHSVQHALNVLAYNNILSAPVIENNIFIGMVDVLDILTFAIKVHNEKPTQIEEAKNWYRALESLTQHGIAEFNFTPIKNIINLSNLDYTFTVNENTRLIELIESFLSKGFHRTPIIDSQNRIVGIISQSDIIQFIANNRNLLGDLGSKTVNELNLGTKGTFTININSQTINAFYLMIQNKISGIAVIDDYGRLVANLSASDIRGLQLTSISSLLLPIPQYLALQRFIKPPMACTLNTTLETIILKLFLFRMHRIWIVDERYIPIGVISLTDIMKLLSTIPIQPTI